MDYSVALHEDQRRNLPLEGSRKLLMQQYLSNTNAIIGVYAKFSE
jgi:hypothetical protein